MCLIASLVSLFDYVANWESLSMVLMLSKESMADDCRWADLDSILCLRRRN